MAQRYQYLSTDGRVIFTGTMEEIAQWECDNLRVVSVTKVELQPGDVFESNLRPVDG